MTSKKAFEEPSQNFWHLHDPGPNTNVSLKKIKYAFIQIYIEKKYLSQYPDIAELPSLKNTNFHLKCINSYPLEQYINYEYDCLNLMFPQFFSHLLFTYTILLFIP